MSATAWLIRPARNTEKDRKRLAAFLCADQTVPWQAEVEAFVRESLFDWVSLNRVAVLDGAQVPEGARYEDAIVAPGGSGAAGPAPGLADELRQHAGDVVVAAVGVGQVDQLRAGLVQVVACAVSTS